MEIYLHNCGPLNSPNFYFMLEKVESKNRYDVIVLPEAGRYMSEDMVSKAAEKYLERYNCLVSEDVVILTKKSIVVKPKTEIICTKSTITFTFQRNEKTYIFSGFYLTPPKTKKFETFDSFVRNLDLLHPAERDKNTFNIICGDMNFDLLYCDGMIEGLGKSTIGWTVNSMQVLRKFVNGRDMRQKNNFRNENLKLIDVFFTNDPQIKQLTEITDTITEIREKCHAIYVFIMN